MIERFFAPIAPPNALGLLDDAAFITPNPGEDIVVSKDMLVAGRHFFANDPPDLIARKALRVNLSDLAAKGAKPIGFMLGLALPSDWRVEWLESFALGLKADAEAFSIPLLGGDTVRSDGGLTLSITIFGSVPTGRMIRRNATRVGDILYVTGTIGDAALGLKCLGVESSPWSGTISANSRKDLISRYHLPQPRIPIASSLLAYARAAMDVSDGFIGDLTKFLRGSGTSARLALTATPFSSAAAEALAIDASLLETALTGGDDYEIIASIPVEHEAKFLAMTIETGVRITRLGRVEPASSDALQIIDQQGRIIRFTRASYVHF